MPIISDSSSPLEKRAAFFRSRIDRSFNDLKRLSEEIYTWVWLDKTHTPQEAFDAFGTDAVELLQISDTFNSFMSAIKPGTPQIGPPEGKTLKRNSDGTVEVK